MIAPNNSLSQSLLMDNSMGPGKEIEAEHRDDDPGLSSMKSPRPSDGPFDAGLAL
jgi:hypothetical protein